MRTLVHLLPASAVATVLATALLLGVASGQTANIGVVPPRLTLIANPGETVTGSVRLTTSSKRVLQVSVGDWTLDEAGRVVFLPAGQGQFSAASWIVPESSTVALDANQLKTFRFTVTVPKGGAEGTYTTMLFFTASPSQLPNEQVGVSAQARIGVAIYVTVAGTQKSGSKLTDFYDGGNGDLVLSVSNLGNTVMRLGGRVELRDHAGQTVATLPIADLPVLRGSSRDVDVKLPAKLAPGFYDAVAFVKDDRGGLLVGELPIQVH